MRDRKAFQGSCAVVMAMLVADVAPAHGQVKDEKLVRQAYQVVDLVTPPIADMKTREHELMRAICLSVAPKDWDANGGRATLLYHPLTHALIVNASEATQAEVSKFLSRLRKIKGAVVSTCR